MTKDTHIDRVLDLARATGGELPKRSKDVSDKCAAEPAVMRSWQRCIANYGLEPHHTPPPTILTRSELRDIRAPVDDLIGIARNEIDRLFSFIGPSDYIVLLTDMKGVTVDFRCPSALTHAARGAGLYPGAIWSEADQGTNGVGTCLHENRPLSIVMDEHFATRNTSLTCTVAPIFGAEGRLIGVLDVSTARPTDHAHQAIMRQIVAAATQRIENIYFSHRHADSTILRLSRDQNFSDIATEARLALSSDGNILEAGSNASRWLVADGETVAGQNAGRILRLSLERLRGGNGAIAIDAIDGERLFVRSGERQASATATHHADRRGTRSKAPSCNIEVPRYDLATLAGRDPAMLTNTDVALRMVDRGLPIVLTGETGTGKGLFAHALHASSARATGAFVTVNCAAIPQELIESELFGYRPGAFTGAACGGFKGRLLEANEGTLFLDEIGDMPLALQTRLLQVLSDRQFTPVGATQPVTLDVAVISATLHDLPQRVRAGQFREDLFFRLSGVTLTLPALRQRSDRDLVIRRVLSDEAACMHQQILLADSTLNILEAYCWPGNMRELRHVIRYAVTLAEGDDRVVLPHHLPPPLDGIVQSTHEVVSQGDARANATEAHMIRLALQRSAWNVTATAVLLDISRATLHRKIRKFGLRRH